MIWIFFAFSNAFWFSAIQVILALISAYALLKVTVFTKSSPVSVVQRGQQSRDFISGTASLFLTAIIAVIFSITTFPADGKVFLFVCDVILIAYLCIWNGWSTNKLLGWKVKFESKNFNPHRE